MGGFPECLSSASDHDRVFFFFPVCCWRMQQKFWDGTCFCIITGFVLNFGANSYFTYLHPPSGCYWWSQWVGSHRGRSGADEVQSCIDSRRWWSSNNLGEQLSLSLSLSHTHTHTHTHTWQLTWWHSIVVFTFEWFLLLWEIFSANFHNSSRWQSFFSLARFHIWLVKSGDWSFPNHSCNKSIVGHIQNPSFVEKT